jgi:hypothetical protein
MNKKEQKLLTYRIKLKLPEEAFVFNGLKPGTISLDFSNNLDFKFEFDFPRKNCR